MNGSFKVSGYCLIAVILYHILSTIFPNAESYLFYLFGIPVAACTFIFLNLDILEYAKNKKNSRIFRFFAFLIIFLSVFVAFAVLVALLTKYFS